MASPRQSHLRQEGFLESEQDSNKFSHLKRKINPHFLGFFLDLSK
jgi:hypothetical protein